MHDPKKDLIQALLEVVIFTTLVVVGYLILPT
jgi:hypothetical protein